MNVINRPAGVDPRRLGQIVYKDFSDMGELNLILENWIAKAGIITRRKKPGLLADFGTVDIETTTVPAGSKWNRGEQPFAVPYLYQFYFAGYVWLFRFDYQFQIFINTLDKFFSDHNVQAVFYDHNFSYEYQFFKSRIDFNPDATFALQSRRIAKAETLGGGIIFRCSYLLSNMSLEKFTENFCDETFRKDKELIDYELLRFPWSELSNEVLYYSCMDVITLYHAVRSIMDCEGDNIKSIPMTNTGYVRRHCRDACLGKNTKDYKSEKGKLTYPVFKRYRAMMQKCMPSLEVYNLLVEAFRGGNTHANRYKVGSRQKGVGSFRLCK